MTEAMAGLMRPRTSRTRSVMSLNGFWTALLEADGTGDASGYADGLPHGTPVAVPGAINEQLLGATNHTGPIWYEHRFDAPPLPSGTRQLIRFDAAPLVAEAWLDGERLGAHEGGFLPFAFDVTERLRDAASHRLVVRVEHGLSLERTPVGGRPGSASFQNYPSTSFDFFPFGGLIRPVRLLGVPDIALADLRIVTTFDTGHAGVVASGRADGAATAALRVRETGSETRVPVAAGRFEAQLDWPDARAWSPADPYLHTLEVTLLDEAGAVLDAYAEPFGVRTVRVDGTALLLNDAPVTLNGFGKHEDFPVFGRGLAPPVIARDAQLLRWTGATSYRTSHYPYAEEALDYADRAGILVVSETSAVGLNFYDETGNVPARLAWCRAELDALIARDRNHPSVVAWSVANEPFAKPIFQPSAASAEAVTMGTEFLTTLVADARERDTTRPVMVVGAQGHPDEYIDVGDILGINRYYGWYTQGGRIAEGRAVLAAELDALAQFGKPVLLTEFGTDTLPGCHAVDAEMWTEEYQAEFIEAYLDEIACHPHVIGAHVWNFADFKTTQGILRAGGLNHKGVFTRDRRPKLAAHVLRRRWGGAT